MTKTRRRTSRWRTISTDKLRTWSLRRIRRSSQTRTRWTKGLVRSVSRTRTNWTRARTARSRIMERTRRRRICSSRLTRRLGMRMR